MTEQPTLEITDDTHAAIVKGEARYELAGGMASWIISVFRHQQEHGQVMADTFLMGVIAGLQHSAMIRAGEVLEEIRNRHR